MKQLTVLAAILLMGTALANDYCANQTLLGFEEATFVLGANVQNSDVQTTANSLRVRLGQPLTQIDSFVTPITSFELFRDTSTNELVLMTSNEKYVCFYAVPTKKPIRFTHEFS